VKAPSGLPLLASTISTSCLDGLRPGHDNGAKSRYASVLVQWRPRELSSQRLQMSEIMGASGPSGKLGDGGPSHHLGLMAKFGYCGRFP
jgi:hypothetical protein